MSAASARAVRPASPIDRTEAGARAAILARLWGAFAREPIPGLLSRRVAGSSLHVTLSDGTVLTGDRGTASPFAVPAPGFAVTVTTRSGVASLTEPGDLVRALAAVLGPHAARLAAELDNSVANLVLARAAQPEPDGGPPMLDRAAMQPDPLVYLEQSIVDGHPLHPGARTRLGLTPDEIRAYAPEHRPTVMLRRVSVPAGRWYGVNHPPYLWLHPWQHDRLRDEHSWLSRVDDELAARPLMSLRTLATARDRHVKTAVDVQMTSAVRTVSPASIHNGHVLSRLLAGRQAGIEVVPELGGGAVIVDGEPDRRLGMVVRLPPPVGRDELALPLAALAAPSPATGEPLVTELAPDPVAIVTQLARVLLPPVFGLLAVGVALEAHGQNLLVVLHDGRFRRLIYRDFGGVRVSARRLHEHGIEPPQLRGDVRSDDPDVLRTKVLASAVTTVLGELVATLGRHGLDEELAWRRVAEVARTLPEPAGIFADTLPVKAMTAMRLADHPTDDLWCHVPNPLAGLR